MSAFHVSLNNRRLVLLAVMSLVASIVAVGANAPAVKADNETIQFAASSSAAISEDAGTVDVDVTVTWDTTFIGPISFDIVQTGGTAEGADFSITGGSFNWAAAPASNTDTFTVTVQSDALYEGTETVELGFASVNGAIPSGVTTHTISINDNETKPTLTVGNASLTEQNGNMVFTVTNPGAVAEDDIDFSYTLGGGTATGGGTDYNSTAGTGTITGSGTSTTVNVPIVEDSLVEGNETFELTITVTSGNADNPAGPATGTINDADTATVAFTAATSNAGEDTTTHDVSVSLNTGGATLQYPVTVPITRTGGTATSGTDFTAISGTSVVFPAASGTTSDTFAITVSPDTLVEGPETINLAFGTITGPATASGQTTHTHTINDADTATVAFTSATSNVQEDTSSPHTPTVTLSTSGATLASSVTVAITDITGTGPGYAIGGGNDYTLDTPSVTFGVGSGNGATRNVSISIEDDLTVEANETIELSMNVTSGIATNGPQTTHVVTIIDDESRNFVITPTDGITRVAENGGTDTFKVHLTKLPTGTVTVNLTKTSLGDEFDISPSQLTFTTGNYQSDQTVIVTGVNDDYDDGNLEGVISLSALGGGYVDVKGTEHVIITDDDTAGVTVTQTGGTTKVTEGGSADTYTVKLNARPTSNVTVSFAYDNSELAVSPTSLIFTTNNWSTAQTVSVTGVADGEAEVTETHTIQHTTTSANTPFSGLTVASVSVTVTNSDELQVSIDGPTVGATGVAATFMGVENASGIGLEYLWTVINIDNGNLLPIEGTKSTFTFTPSSGGHYGIVVAINDKVDLEKKKDFFIEFTVLGDLGSSVFTSDILWLAEEGITKGCNPPANDEYCPTDRVTRGQMAAFLVRFLGLTAQNPAIDFTDDNGSIFETNIEQLATAGITKGCNPPTNNKYCPNNYVTRGQMAAFLVRALNLTDDGGGDLFTDDDASVFENNIDMLATAGITKGCNPSEGNTKFCPNDYVTRGQMAAFLHRAEDLLP
jgi:hypothetical protein